MAQEYVWMLTESSCHIRNEGLSGSKMVWMGLSSKVISWNLGVLTAAQAIGYKTQQANKYLT